MPSPLVEQREAPHVQTQGGEVGLGHARQVREVLRSAQDYHLATHPAPDLLVFCQLLQQNGGNVRRNGEGLAITRDRRIIGGTGRGVAFAWKKGEKAYLGRAFLAFHLQGARRPATRWLPTSLRGSIHKQG